MVVFKWPLFYLIMTLKPVWWLTLQFQLLRRLRQEDCLNPGVQSHVVKPYFIYKQSLKITRCQWLMPVILATQEAEIRRVVVRSQPGQIVRETLSQKYTGGVAQGKGPEFKP
jgi:hypothetical protein